MHSQELPGRTGSGMSCVTLQTITSVFKYPIKCRDQFYILKKRIVEKENLWKKILKTSNYQYKQFKAWKNCCIFNWSDSTSKLFLPMELNGFRSDRPIFLALSWQRRQPQLKEEGLWLWIIWRMTTPSETSTSYSTTTEADLLPSVPRRAIQVWKHTSVSVKKWWERIGGVIWLFEHTAHYQQKDNALLQF